QRRSLPQGAPAHAGPVRAHHVHVVRPPGGDVHAAQRGSRVPQVTRGQVRRLDPARALPGDRLLGVRAGPRRALSPALLLHGAGRLERAGADRGRASARHHAVAGHARALVGHLCGPGLPGPARMNRPVAQVGSDPQLVAFGDEVRRQALMPGWGFQSVPSNEPVPIEVPYRWSWTDVLRPMMVKAYDLVDPVKAERRNLIMSNPGLKRAATTR